MFDLDLGDELELLVETTRSFAQDELAPRLREHEQARAVVPEVRAAFKQIGLAGLELPESLGGAGLGALARALVNEELGAADPGAALALDPLGPALYAIAELGGEAALREWALPLVEADQGRALLVCAADATLEIGAEQVSGQVPFVPAEQPALLVLLDGEEAVLVREGFSSEPLHGAGLRAAGAAALTLDAAPIVARWRDRAAASRALTRARLYVASLLVGVLRQAADFSRGYALERHAFGRPIAHHQGLAFLITDMFMAVEGARLLLHEAAWHAARGLECEALAAQAFVEAVCAQRLVGPNGVQILGGHGFMQDYPVEKYMRESRALGLFFGGVDAARDTAGQRLCAGPLPVPLSHQDAL